MRPTALPIVLILAAFLTNCGATGSGTKNPDPAGVSVSVGPAMANVRLNASQSFAATISGTTNQSVTWEVNGVAGGAVGTGTVSATGTYVAPSALGSASTVTISAVSADDSSASGTSTVTLWNPMPALSSVSPSVLATGAFNITVTGTNFVSGAQVQWAGATLSTAYVSSTQLTAIGTAATAGTFAVGVINPNPGSSSSAAINVQVNPSSVGQAGTCGGISVGQGANLNGFVPFPADNLWNTDISGAAVDPNSSAIIGFIGATDPVHADFGSGEYDGQSIGIPYVVVGAQQGMVGINFTAYGDESDPGPMPVPANAPIEGYPSPGDGDRHVLVLDQSNCWLYELYNAAAGTGGTWNAASAAVWDMSSDGKRPLTWTSADAAGLPIFPGLARYDEVASGAINHALRFTLQSSRAAFVPPASHWAANSTNANAAPMGMRLRLKADFDISGYSATNQVILRALQKYGMIMADNGSNMFISGAPDDRWDNDDLHQLANVTAADFDVVQMNPIYTQSNLPAGATPAIGNFSASALTTTAGVPVTLSWAVTGASYLIVSPQIGTVRGTSVAVTPSQTTAYTLTATNEFGRTTASVTVTVISQ
ncbi:MAG: IPT/TIG domain-containing protein [Candidatus Acidiferrales bacterium]